MDRRGLSCHRDNPKLRPRQLIRDNPQPRPLKQTSRRLRPLRLRDNPRSRRQRLHNRPRRKANRLKAGNPKTAARHITSIIRQYTKR